jgi:hypothetical protein
MLLVVLVDKPIISKRHTKEFEAILLSCCCQQIDFQKTGITTNQYLFGIHFP